MTALMEAAAAMRTAHEIFFMSMMILKFEFVVFLEFGKLKDVSERIRRDPPLREKNCWSRSEEK